VFNKNTSLRVFIPERKDIKRSPAVPENGRALMKFE
jgi:hypothetical protein